MCPDCGPRVWLETVEGGLEVTGDAAIIRTQDLLAEGGIVAIKGLGGFHLACDTTSGACTNLSP
jgi:hydrogenase maturation protein HypF